MGQGTVEITGPKMARGLKKSTSPGIGEHIFEHQEKAGGSKSRQHQPRETERVRYKRKLKTYCKKRNSTHWEKRSKGSRGDQLSGEGRGRQSYFFGKAGKERTFTKKGIGGGVQSRVKKEYF